LSNIDVDALRKCRVIFDAWTQLLNRYDIQVVYEKDDMGIADGQGLRMFERTPRHGQSAGVHRIGEGDLIPCESRLTQADLDLLAKLFTLKKAAVAVDAPCTRELNDAARCIAAAFHFAAVAVPDAHSKVGAFARFEHDQLVAANACSAVTDGAGERRRDAERLLAGINDHEIIAEPMHLVEVPPHRARDLGSGPDLVHQPRVEPK